MIDIVQDLDALRARVAGWKREGLRVLYLDVAESAQPIRYMAEAGSARFLHANSLGKALLSLLNEEALNDLVQDAETRGRVNLSV